MAIHIVHLRRTEHLMPTPQNQDSTLPASGKSDSQPGAGGPLHRALLATAWVAGLFCVVLCAVMLYNHVTASTNDPWKSPQLIALKEKLVTEPKNEAVKKEIRRLDFEFRQHYRRRLALNGLGGWLLLGGALLLVVTSRQARELSRKPPLPQGKHEAIEQRARHDSARARWAVATAGAAIALTIFGITLGSRSVLPASAEELDKLLGRAPTSEGGAPERPSLADFQANSPRFRGWDGNAVCTQTNFTLAWDANSGAGIAWKVPVPALGHGSPIVWSNRVFLSGGDVAKRSVFCFDTASGQPVWQRAIENVPGSPAQQPEVPADTTFAASTPATDGRRVFAIFANGDLAALSFDGTIAWAKNLGVPKNTYGFATSLAVWPGKLIVQFDQGDAESAGSKLLALDPATGRVLWERPRPVPASWATPVIVEAAGKPQIITLGKPWVIGYALADGTELWRAEVLEGEITPSPVFAGGRVLAISPSAKLIALRPDGAGDVTKSHVAWSAEDNVPDVTSPVANSELAFTISSGGLLTCFELNDGKKVWEKDLETEVQASPSIVGDRVLVLGVKGVAVMVEAGRQFKEVSRSELPDHFLASPAFADGKMFLRGTTNLWCVGAGPAKEGKPQ
jgi:outer membrane protein assembly factor BamB